MSNGTALIVGAYSGIGKSIALHRAEARWRVGLTPHNESNLHGFLPFMAMMVQAAKRRLE